jgi:hypothetical protein
VKVAPSIFIEVTQVNITIGDVSSKICFRLLSENMILVHSDPFNFKLLALDYTTILSSSIFRDSALRDGMTL